MRSRKRKLHISIILLMTFLLIFSSFGFIGPITDVKADESYLVGDFPADYKELLAKVHAVYPNYVFQADHTNSDFYGSEKFH